MSGKFMKVKRIMIPTITMLIIASQLMGCAAANQSEMLQMINNGDQIEIEVAVPAFAEQEQGEQSQLTWIELSNLETNDTLRDSWDDLLLITSTETGKNGIFYVNNEGVNVNNNTLQMVLHNRAFVKYLESEDGIADLAEGAINNYADLSAEEEYKAVLAGINGYFNLLPDLTPSYCNIDSTISRNEFLAMVMRAETPVSEIEADMNYESIVGVSDYNIYAQEIAGNSYLTLTDKSLNNMTANGTITRAEVIYTLVNRYYADELANVDLSSVTFDDCKDGGDIATEQQFAGKEYCDSYELTYALTNPDSGCPTDLYRAIVVAYNVGILDSTETRWDEAATLGEVVEFIMNAHINDDSIAVFNYSQGTISGYEAPEEENTDTTDIGTINENDSLAAEGDYNPDEEDELATEETEVVEEEITEETETTTESTYQVSDMDRQFLIDTVGLTEEEVNNISSQMEFEQILSDWVDSQIPSHSGGSNSGGGNSSSSSGSNSGGNEDPNFTDGLLTPAELIPGEDVLPGSM